MFGIKDRTKRLFEIAVRTEANVLITGATGTGKTTLARKIHDSSPRKNRPFVSVNLATLHEGTLESELFGHEKGAFTGADQKRVGKLAAAEGGTVFLDEIGELPLRLQARLLDFLQNRRICPVGGNRDVELNVRVIAATHRNLKVLVQKGEFRADLLHRLRVISMDLPSLSDHTGAMDEVVHRCLEEICVKTQKKVLRLSADVVNQLEAYPWPGNYRELRNCLEFAVLSAENGEITTDDLPSWFMERFEGLADKSLSVFEDIPFDYYGATSHFERMYLEQALKRNHGRVNQTAASIGINKTTMIRRLRALGLRMATEASFKEVSANVAAS